MLRGKAETGRDIVEGHVQSRQSVLPPLGAAAGSRVHNSHKATLPRSPFPVGNGFAILYNIRRHGRRVD